MAGVADSVVWFGVVPPSTHAHAAPVARRSLVGVPDDNNCDNNNDNNCDNNNDDSNVDNIADRRASGSDVSSLPPRAVSASLSLAGQVGECCLCMACALLMLRSECV